MTDETQSGSQSESDRCSVVQMIGDAGIGSVVENTARMEVAQGATDSHPLSLWYEQPASEWLEALPDEWDAGSVAGLKAVGDFEIDLEWENGRLQRAVLQSGSGNRCRIRTYGVRLVAEKRCESDRSDDPQVIAFDTEPGEVVPLEAEPIDVPDVALPTDSGGFSITETGETTRIRVPVRNEGTTASSPTTVQLVDISDTNQPTIDSEQLPTLPGDTLHEVTFEITTQALPDDLTQVWAVVDPSAVVPDLDRTNNVTAIT